MPSRNPTTPNATSLAARSRPQRRRGADRRPVIGESRLRGSNSFGTLGTGGSVDAVAPRGVLAKSLSGVVPAWAGGNRVLALESDGSLYFVGVASTADGRVLRVPTVMTTFALSAPRQP